MTDERRAKMKENSARWNRNNPEKRAAISRAWKLRNPEKVKANLVRYKVSAKAKRARLAADRKRMYGIDADEQARLIADGCGICGEVAAHIDHCHSTGKVRGGLCRSCNLGLGHFKDAPERLIAAVRYLIKESHT